MLRDAALNLCVAGECYLVQTPARLLEGTPERWDIKSVDEVTVSPSGGIQLRSRASGGLSALSAGDELPANAFVGRVWRTHPRFTDDPDSSMRGVLELCDELLLLNRAFRATARSRLNAGALFIPDELSVGSSAVEDAAPIDPVTGVSLGLIEEDEKDEFEEELVEAMSAPITDESSASAIVPLLIRGPADLGDKIKLIKFERSFDEQLRTRSDRVLERILQGLDLPKDIVTGLADVRYSNAFAIEESLYKAHIEPLVLMICDALTVIYLRPMLLAYGFTEEQVKKIVVWYDPSEVVTRPDRANDADIGYDRKILSASAWRRAHGFTDRDKPLPDEILERLAVERGALSEAVTEALIKRLDPVLLAQVRADSLAQSPSPIPPTVNDLLQGPGQSSPAAAEPPPPPTDGRPASVTTPIPPPPVPAARPQNDIPVAPLP